MELAAAGWLGSRRRATRAARRVSQAVVANEVESLSEDFESDFWVQCDCDYCDGAARSDGCKRIASEDDVRQAPRLTYRLQVAA